MIRMSKQKQKQNVAGASNEFIRDVSSFMNKLRKQPHLVGSRHKATLRKHKQKLRRLVSSKTPIHVKRAILQQKGGIIPLLIPLIVAAIGATGAVGAAATHAGIMRA